MDAGVVLGIVVVAYLLIAPALGIAGFVRARRQARDVAAALNRLEMLARELGELRAHEAHRQEAPAPPATDAPTPEPQAETAAAPTPAEPSPREAEAPAPEPIETPPPPVAPAPASAAPRPGLEEQLTSRWMLWLGAVALILAGAFLVKYAVDEGWLGPAARCGAGMILGLGLTAWGEWLRRRPTQRAVAAVRTNFVPLAFSAAGVWIAYASAYAAFELYDLLSPLLAFSLLAAISVGAVALALGQGPFLALLGVLGGDATPMLVPSDVPSAWSLFVYLTVIAAASLSIVRLTRAWWLAQLTFAGAGAWTLLWFAGFWHAGDGAAVGAFLLGQALLALLVPQSGLLNRTLGGSPGEPWWPRDVAESTVWAVVGAVALLVFILLRMDAYGPASLAALGWFVVLCGLVGVRAPRLAPAAVLAEVLTLAGFATWHVAQILQRQEGFFATLPPQSEALPPGWQPVPLLPPETVTFLGTAAGFAALIGVGAFAVLRRVPRAGLWASVSASAPVLLLAIAYWRVEDFSLTVSWALVAVGVAALQVLAAGAVQARREDAQFRLALGAYAAGASTAIAFGAAMTLREGWLTVAFAVQLPVLAWIGRRLVLPQLRFVAAALAVVVLARLALNVSIVEYHVGDLPLLNWILYGYGVPAAAFLLAARWFAGARGTWLVMLLQAGALAFVALLVTLELHTLIAGPLTEPRDGLLEPSLQSAAWLAMGLALLALPAFAGNVVALWGGRVLVALGAAQVLFVQGLGANPLWTDISVGTWPLLNLLLLAYGVPAVVLSWYGWRGREEPAWARGAAWVLAFVLLFVELSLEVRHAFHGAWLSMGATSDAEWYVYSAAWLGFALLLLALGIRTGSIALRYASLAALLLTVGKVFLSDMAALTGLYRVVSFLGLGLCLIGVGYLYQRFVFPPRK
jgi:uncharacterized membrane protein